MGRTSCEIVPDARVQIVLDATHGDSVRIVPMKTINDVVSLWPSISEFAADAGVAYGVAQQWRRRNSIPAERWSAVVAAASRRGVPVVLETLAAIARDRAA